ncbi:response regulator transcription factor [Paenibacillus sp. J2TS4]|uniref:response regulator transcription factor n=1 Tax=Paenibacillus sp. J2TS4 TaxID=2807194 RepID=UPI001B19E864|nr:response regulator transcription factor [Paenibacillus sp. J2TS4]GIP32217.1 DNA-binding response regulator [Paenibacillus sp. J2TS4]
MSQLIAIVDDELHIRQIVEAYMQKEGYRTIGLSSAEEALELRKVMPPDLWVLDIMLPGMDGYQFCRQIRNVDEVPIIMISAKDEEVDKILGLELGSDDYLTKPFSPRELVAKVNRLLLRWSMQQVNGRTGSESSPKTLLAGILQIFPEERRVWWHGTELEMTAKEFMLLNILADKPNHAYSRGELLDAVWGTDYYGSDRAVDDLVKRIRKKMNRLPLETVWGYGYRLRSTEEESWS